MRSNALVAGALLAILFLVLSVLFCVLALEARVHHGRPSHLVSPGSIMPRYQS